MKQFVACVKKEFYEFLRGKRFLVYILIAVGMVVMNMGMLAISKILFEQLEGSDLDLGLEEINPFSLSISIADFSSNFISIMMIAVIIILGQSVSSEIKKKKWLVPICAGISPSKMIYAKFLVQCSIVSLTTLVSYLLNVLVSITFMEIDVKVGIVVFTGISLVIAMTFISVLTLGISAITKKTWIAILIPILLYEILSMLFMTKTGISVYAPSFYFYNVAVGAISKFVLHKFLIALFITFVTGGIIVFASAKANDGFMKIV